MSKIIFTEIGFSHYVYWQTQDKKILKKINKLLQSISRDGAMEGEGKPEKLKHKEGEFSRRIDEKWAMCQGACGCGSWVGERSLPSKDIWRLWFGTQRGVKIHLSLPLSLPPALFCPFLRSESWPDPICSNWARFTAFECILMTLLTTGQERG